MIRSFKIITSVFFTFLCINAADAQSKSDWQKKLPDNDKYRLEDSLLRVINNRIYYTYYSPGYMDNKRPVFTYYKVDLNWEGKIIDLKFSDSADTAFVSAYLRNTQNKEQISTIEKYAKIKGYRSVSLIIPVSYEPDYQKTKKIFSYEDLELMMQFNKTGFTGKSIWLPAIAVKINATGNM